MKRKIVFLVVVGMLSCGALGGMKVYADLSSDLTSFLQEVNKSLTFLSYASFKVQWPGYPGNTGLTFTDSRYFDVIFSTPGVSGSDLNAGKTYLVDLIGEAFKPPKVFPPFSGGVLYRLFSDYFGKTPLEIETIKNEILAGILLLPPISAGETNYLGWCFNKSKLVDLNVWFPLYVSGSRLYGTVAFTPDARVTPRALDPNIVHKSSNLVMVNYLLDQFRKDGLQTLMGALYTWDEVQGAVWELVYEGYGGPEKTHNGYIHPDPARVLQIYKKIKFLQQANFFEFLPLWSFDELQIIAYYNSDEQPVACGINKWLYMLLYISGIL